MKKRLASAQAIQNASYETTASRFKNPDLASQHRKFLKLLDDEQAAVGPAYRVILEIKNYGNVLLPFFSYQRRSDTELKVEETLKRVKRMKGGQ